MLTTRVVVTHDVTVPYITSVVVPVLLITIGSPATNAPLDTVVNVCAPVAIVFDVAEVVVAWPVRRYMYPVTGGVGIWTKLGTPSEYLKVPDNNVIIGPVRPVANADDVGVTRGVVEYNGVPSLAAEANIRVCDGVPVVI